MVNLLKIKKKKEFLNLQKGEANELRADTLERSKRYC